MGSLHQKNARSVLWALIDGSTFTPTWKGIAPEGNAQHVPVVSSAKLMTASAEPIEEQPAGCGSPFNQYKPLLHSLLLDIQISGCSYLLHILQAFSAHTLDLCIQLMYHHCLLIRRSRQIVQSRLPEKQR